MILYCSFSNKMSVDDQNHWICVGLSRLLHSVLGKFSHDGMNFVKQTQRLEFTFWINKVWHTKTAQLSIESGCRALLTLIFTQLLCFTDIFGYYTWALPLYPTWCLYHLTFQTHCTFYSPTLISQIFAHHLIEVLQVKCDEQVKWSTATDELAAARPAAT